MEVDTLQNYIEIEQMRFDDAFEFKISIHDSIDKFNSYIPGMLIQPFVENAILHGILNKETKGRINISFKKVESNKNIISCIIDDNGIGREAAKDLRKPNEVNTRKSIGIALTKKRLQQIGTKMSEQIEIIDKKGPKGNPIGTKVILYIPVNLKVTEKVNSHIRYENYNY